MIKHVLADGTVLDSIEGHVVPATGAGETVYRLLAGVILENSLSHGRKEEKNGEKVS